MSFPLLTRSMHNRLIRTRGKEPDTSQQQQCVYEHTCASGRFFLGWLIMVDGVGWIGAENPSAQLLSGSLRTGHRQRNQLEAG